MHTLRKTTATAGVALLVLGLASACSSSGTASHPGSPTPTTTAPRTTSSTPASRTPTTHTATTSGGSTPVGPAGGPVPAKFTPTSTTFISPATGWVLGTAPCSNSPCTSILRTRDGGRSWRGIPAPRATLGQPDSGRNGAVSVLRFADDSDGWAGVGQLYSTHDGGATWKRQHIGTSTSVVSDIETGGGYVYASTYGCPSQGGNNCSQTSRVYASPIGSDHWQAVSATLSGGGRPVGLVVHGQDWYLPITTGIYHGHGTAAPTRRPNPCPAENGFPAVPAIAVADNAHLDALCFGGGAAGSAQYQLYGTSDGGQHWRKAGRQRIEPSGLYGIADNAHGVLLAAVSSGASEILRTTDDGATLTNASIAAPSGGIAWADLGFTTPTQAVVVLVGTAMYLSHDAGATFTKISF